LQLDPAVNLLPEDTTPAPLRLVSATDSLDHFVQRALLDRPELHMSTAQREAARRARDAAKYAPLVPVISGQYAYGGLAGGTGNEIANFNDSSDYGVGLSWRIGPGGLFDVGRIAAGESRLRTTELQGQKLHDEIVRQVVDTYTRVHSLSEQIAKPDGATQPQLFRSSDQLGPLRRSKSHVGFGVQRHLVAIELQRERCVIGRLVSAKLDQAGVVG